MKKVTNNQSIGGIDLSEVDLDGVEIKKKLLRVIAYSKNDVKERIQDIAKLRSKRYYTKNLREIGPILHELWAVVNISMRTAIYAKRYGQKDDMLNGIADAFRNGKVALKFVQGIIQNNINVRDFLRKTLPLAYTLQNKTNRLKEKLSLEKRKQYSQSTIELVALLKDPKNIAAAKSILQCYKTKLKVYSSLANAYSTNNNFESSYKMVVTNYEEINKIIRIEKLFRLSSITRKEIDENYIYLLSAIAPIDKLIVKNRKKILLWDKLIDFYFLLYFECHGDGYQNTSSSNVTMTRQLDLLLKSTVNFINVLVKLGNYIKAHDLVKKIFRNISTCKQHVMQHFKPNTLNDIKHLKYALDRVQLFVAQHKELKNKDILTAFQAYVKNNLRCRNINIAKQNEGSNYADVLALTVIFSINGIITERFILALDACEFLLANKMTEACHTEYAGLKTMISMVPPQQILAYYQFGVRYWSSCCENNSDPQAIRTYQQESRDAEEKARTITEKILSKKKKLEYKKRAHEGPQRKTKPVLKPQKIVPTISEQALPLSPAKRLLFFFDDLQCATVGLVPILKADKPLQFQHYRNILQTIINEFRSRSEKIGGIFSSKVCASLLAFTSHYLTGESLRLSISSDPKKNITMYAKRLTDLERTIESYQMAVQQAKILSLLITQRETLKSLTPICDDYSECATWMLHDCQTQRFELLDDIEAFQIAMDRKKKDLIVRKLWPIVRRNIAEDSALKKWLSEKPAMDMIRRIKLKTDQLEKSVNDLCGYDTASFAPSYQNEPQHSLRNG